MRIYESMRRAGADLLVYLGDLIYADQPLPAEVKLDDGTMWRNLVTPEKAKVAETLADYRGNFRYNLLDAHVRAFNASTAQFVIWDDHEVRDNWYPTQRLDRDPRYAEKSVALLSAFARTAFLEYTPTRRNPVDPERIYRTCQLGPLLEVIGWDMRSYRSANSANTQSSLTAETAILGRTQLAWVKERLAASTATWKVIASDMPVGLVVPDYPLELGTFEAVANRNDGAPLGRELEIADLLRFIRDRRIRNVVFITADVHYGAAYHYAPDRAAFTEFDPFWEFVAGPAHAGTFGPNPTDATFGPRLEFVGIPEGMKPNRPPSDGFQFFGTFTVNAGTRALTATLHKQSGEAVFTKELPPAP
jgi:alkaline phosphatase D